MFQNDREGFEHPLQSERVGDHLLVANAQGFHRAPPLPHSA
jgi:hypothetical protein